MKKPPTVSSKGKKKQSGPGRGTAPGFIAHRIKPGQVLNPRGRTKGSRNVFAEKFIKDFLNDWDQHGPEAVERCREEKPTEYVRIGATLLPKDFHLKMTNEAEFEKILDQFDTTELKAILAVFAKYGSEGTEGSAEEEDS